MSNYYKDMQQQHDTTVANIKSPNKLKMYILVKDSIPIGLAMAAVAHAAISCFDEYIMEPTMTAWYKCSFRKVICKVTEAEFNKVKSIVANIVTMTESSLGDTETAIALCPREEWPNCIRYLRLYK